MKKRSLTIDGHRTSISLEDEFWDGLKHISTVRGCALIDIIREIDEKRKSGLSSAIRIFVLNYYKDPGA
ncbi:ribbon-helix-helix domain-containing protein [Candidatus Bodocaedibacter vickermanii]|uniref:Aryl-sulfate sulfotransferase n=1 Tax=Candidatus Bodocaedibacter vickermanii TaxID=2741701 RepID=A0A7L9RU94_9PROT|nr:aryl-sulfate sulfotransferase [Candidatus Paracaedibacteraceae bacterium 'Lake Konstanz']